MTDSLNENQDYLIHVIRNLRQARWELKHGFLMSCDCYLDYCLGLLLKKRNESQ